ncbi:hypothetical protein [Mesoterricola sediminis]|uniref:Uncharacterized protein n=1 Tax=Mesoterricola sediminis TaxID=2927980 RepID=A0AA48HDI0_9BACT|nr:hypothetical protein [Mesoterricola sediminis]BDU76263.1 hypothetical protein METESE_12210 [Mesoterricola sediminis]
MTPYAARILMAVLALAWVALIALAVYGDQMAGYIRHRRQRRAWRLSKRIPR